MRQTYWSVQSSRHATDSMAQAVSLDNDRGTAFLFLALILARCNVLNVTLFN